MDTEAAQSQIVETGLIELAHSDIEYFSRRQGDAIVLLPGGTLTVRYLDGLAEALAEAGLRVVGINFLGAGNSTRSTFGNRVARMVAATRPDLIRSVILLAAGGKFPPVPVAAQALGVVFNPASTDARCPGGHVILLRHCAISLKQCQFA